MSNWIICPYHKDTEPSMKVYEKYSHCFVCGAHVLNIKIGEVLKYEPNKKFKTDIPTMVKYIQSLPMSKIRGIDFHKDGYGFYIIWPSGNYYKRRNNAGSARYTGPSGIKAPLLIYPGNKNHLVLIEGEINAISIYLNANFKGTIASPGSASEFIRHIDQYKNYKKITLILDHDAAGVAFGLQVKESLLLSNKRVSLITRLTDYNDVLQKQGSKVMVEEFRKDIE